MPRCELGHVLRDVFLRVLFSRRTHGPRGQIVLSSVDVAYAFRQVLFDPVRAPVFGYAMGGHVVVDLRLQLGWRNSPGFWALMAAALEHAHTHSTFRDAVVPPQEAAAVEHVQLAPSRGVPIKWLPCDCRSVAGRGGNTRSYVFMRYYVDDVILVEVQWWSDDCRCL